MKKFKGLLRYKRKSKSRLNKKGIIFMSMMAVLFFILLLYSYKVLVIDKKAFRTVGYAGESALRIYNSIGEADLKEFLIKQGFKYSIYEAINKTAWEGGGCEFWNENCDPYKKCRDLFKKYVQEFFKVYLGRIPIRKNDIGYVILCDDKFCELNVKKFQVILPSFPEQPLTGVIERNFKYKQKFKFNFEIYSLYYQLKSINTCKGVNKLKKDLEGKYNVELKCYGSSEEKYINMEIVMGDMLFIRPVIKFRLGEEAEALKVLR